MSMGLGWRQATQALPTKACEEAGRLCRKRHPVGFPPLPGAIQG